MWVISRYSTRRKPIMIFSVLLVFSMISMIIPVDSTSSLQKEKTRGVDGWMDIVEGDGFTFIDETHDMLITYDDQEETLTFSESYDPYFDLAPKIRNAVDRSPQWLNDTLVWSFTNIYSSYRMKFAEILLNESIDFRYLDEMAFTMAYMPSTFMNYYKIEGKYLWENAHMLYTVSDDVRYASISDYNLSDGQHSTITYSTPSGNITMPEDIYYWYVVMPKIGHDNLEYMDPETLDFAYSYEGGEFWRTWLYYNNDTDYPLLKDSLADQEYLWEGKMNEIEDNGAVGAVTKWEMDSIMFGMPQVRKINPIYVYKNHLGMCGENAYILAAAAKVALIPTVITVTWEGGHEWNDFWERGWHHWEGYSGQIDNPSIGGAPSAFTSVNPDFSHISLMRSYTSTSNLTIRVKDLDGNPADGVMVKLHGYPAQNVDGSLSLIANLTDVNGESTFEIGTGFDYFLNYRAPIGGTPDQNAQAIHVCKTDVVGADYIFNLTLQGRMPLKVNYTKTEESNYGLRFNITAGEIDHLTKYYEDDLNFNVDIWKRFEGITRLTLLFLDNENYQGYKNGQKFYPGGVLNLTEDGTGSIILEDQKWHILLSGKSAPLTRTFATLDISVERSLVTPEARISSPREDSVYEVGEAVPFEGYLDFLMGIYDDFSFKWSDVEGTTLSEDRIFSLSFEEGDHTVNFEVRKGGNIISTSSVNFTIYQPNRDPVAMIESPPPQAEYPYDHEVQFSANGSSDPDEDSLNFMWKYVESNMFLSDQKEFSSKFDPGVHWIELTVDDGRGLNAIQRVKFTILEQVFPPVPVIISPIQGLVVIDNERIELNATGTSDPDGDELDYKWISSIDGVISMMMVDSVLLSQGEHTIELQVTDGIYTESLFVNVTVIDEDALIDLEPVAIVLSPSLRSNYYVTDLIEFNASSSYDPDENSVLEFEWWIDGHLVSEDMVFHFTLPGGDHEIKLIVKSNGLISNSTLIISVIDRPPTICVNVEGNELFDGESIEVNSLEIVIFNGSGCMDPEGSALLFEWSINDTMISTDTILAHSFEPGEYLLELTISDEGGNTKSFLLYVTALGILGDDDRESQTGDEKNIENESFNPFWLIISIFIILVILCLIIFLAVRLRRKGENQMDEEIEG